MKKLTIALCSAIAFAVPALAQQTQTKNGTWTYSGYDYELWSENNAGTTSMTLNGTTANGGTFTASWQNTINILFRAGKKFSTTTGGTISGREPPKTALDYGNISIDFAATWSSSDNVKMLGVYGWAFYKQGSIPTKDENGSNKTFTNEIEYYIIQDRGSYNAALGGDTKSTLKGTATIDGIEYEFRVCDRLGKNALSGSSVNFKQYFSVPKNTSSHRTSGKISVSEHFKKWAEFGMKMDGPLYEVALKVESYTGQNSSAKGSATITKNLLTIGGTSTTSSNSTGGTSSSSSKPQATTCKTPLITYPTNTVPSDPYTACFKYTNNKCYVCKVDNEGDGNTCASGWVWDGTQIESNLKDGYWYKEVTCPATSSSSTTPSSSSRPPSSSSMAAPSTTCNDYQASFCGDVAWSSVLGGSTTVPNERQCLYIGDFETIQPSLNSTVVINGVVNTCGEDWDNCPYNEKPATKKDGGYYVYLRKGSINTYENNGWKGIVAKPKPTCSAPPTPSSSSIASSSSAAAAVVPSSSSRAASSSSATAVVPSSSSRAASSSSTATTASSSSNASVVSSSSTDIETSSSSGEDNTPILNSQFSTLNSSITYYSIKGEPLGKAKPQKAGVYIVKQGSSIKKIVVR